MTVTTNGASSTKPSSPRRLHAPQDYAELLDRYDTWLFDCDGVLWRGTTLIDGASEFLQLLRSKKKSVIFVTNNAATSRPSYKKKFDKLGIEAHVDEIFGSAFAAAVYLSTVINFPKDKKVFVIGMKGLEDELREEGISFVGGTNPEDNTLVPFNPTSYTPDPSIGAVLCGLDTAINYTKLSKAFIHLHTDPTCLFLATNEDSTYPAQGGVLLPGAGAISAPLRFALGRNPVCLGKPERVMLDCIRAKHGFDPQRTIMVGDRLNTDILFGKQGGLSTLLVLTGNVSYVSLPFLLTILPPPPLPRGRHQRLPQLSAIISRRSFLGWYPEGIAKETDLLPENAPPALPDYVTNSIDDLRKAEKLYN